MKSTLCRIYEAVRDRKRLGLSEKQVADEEIEQLDLIRGPGRNQHVSDAQRLRDGHPVSFGG